MGQTISTGLATINTSVAAAVPILSSNQTLVNIQSTGTGALQSKYTVTTGKTLYITTFAPSMNGTGASYLYANDGTTKLLGIDSAAGLAAINPTGPVLAVYTSGQQVKVNIANTFDYNIVGVEQ